MQGTLAGPLNQSYIGSAIRPFSRCRNHGSITQSHSFLVSHDTAGIWTLPCPLADHFPPSLLRLTRISPTELSRNKAASSRSWRPRTPPNLDSSSSPVPPASENQPSSPASSKSIPTPSLSASRTQHGSHGKESRTGQHITSLLSRRWRR